MSRSASAAWAAPPLPPRPEVAPAGAASPSGTTAGGWAGRLELGFARRGGRTVLARREHRGPLLVQRPFYPEGDESCHVYLLHPPGGVVGGDRLAVRVDVGEEAEALLTTPAATKLYRSAGPLADLTQALSVADGALLEWLPGETIAFDGAEARLATRVTLEPGARGIGWEVLCLGRPFAGEAFRHGAVEQRLEIWREGRPLLHERAHYAGGGALLQAPWGLAGKPVTGTLWAVRPEGGLGRHLAELGLVAGSDALAPPEGGLAGITELGEVLIARCLAPHAEAASGWLRRIWEALRPALAGRAACPPRIWRT